MRILIVIAVLLVSVSAAQAEVGPPLTDTSSTVDAGVSSDTAVAEDEEVVQLPTPPIGAPTDGDDEQGIGQKQVIGLPPPSDDGGCSAAAQASPTGALVLLGLALLGFLGRARRRSVVL